MWAAVRERFAGGQKVLLTSDGVRLSFGAVLAAWQGDSTFGDFFLTELAAAPFTAFYWEMPPVVAGDIDRPYEYVTIDSPALRSAREDGSPFGAYLTEGGSGAAVTAFPNLSGGAMLVAPLPIGSAGANAHIASFVRGAPRFQQRALLGLTAELALGRLSERPTWVSTSGTGVHWLHVRIEGTPTYYTHRPYRDYPARPG
jgi:hypothetical protein